MNQAVVIAAFLSLALLTAVPAAFAEGSPTPEQIAEAVKNLGHEDFLTREQATRFLWEAGQASELALRAATGSDDPEVVLRAKQILDKFDQGIFPDTPPEVLAMIRQFKSSDEHGKLQVLRRLIDQKHVRTALALIRSQPDEAVRRRWRQRLTAGGELLVRQILVDGDLKTAEQWLELGAVDDQGMRNWAAYHRLRGSLDQQIEALTAEAEHGDDARRQRQLAWALRTRGDLPAALAAAREANNSTLVATLLVESGQWRQLSAAVLRGDDEGVEDKPADPFANRSMHIAERLGWQCAFHRLAGDDEAFAAALAQLQQQSKENRDSSHYFAEALFFNNQFESAIQLKRETSPQTALELLAFQLRYQEAFAAVGVKELGGDPTRWFRPLVDDPEFRLKPKRESGPGDTMFRQAAEVARQLALLGETDAANQLYDFLIDATRDAASAYRMQLIAERYKAGQRDLALESAAELGFDEEVDAWFSHLYGRQNAPAASAFWRHVRADEPDLSPRDALLRVDQWIRRPLPRWEEGEFAKLIRACVQPLPDEEPVAHRDRISQLADYCQQRGAVDLEIELRRAVLEHEATEDVSRTTARRALGVALAKADQWEEAAEHFSAELEDDQLNVVARWLWSEALRQSGKKDEATEQQSLALLLCLGEGRAHHELAAAMRTHGRLDLARQRWEFILATDSPESWYCGNAAQQLGNAISDEDPIRAAALWEQMMLRVLKTNSAIIEASGHLSLPHVIHKVRGKGLLHEGKFDEAMRHFEIAHQAAPGNIDLALDITPLLEKAEHRDLADQLFDKVHAATSAVCRDFPNSAHHHNQTAWLCVRCRRNLDKAFTHATTAVKLQPDRAAYLDTLAEVHFAQGNAAQAVELIKRCQELEPENSFFAQRLEEFRQPPSPEK